MCCFRGESSRSAPGRPCSISPSNERTRTIPTSSCRFQKVSGRRLPLNEAAARRRPQPLPRRHARRMASWISAVGGAVAGVVAAPRPHRPLRRSEEHTSELQSRENLVCRLLLEKKKNKNSPVHDQIVVLMNVG